MKNLREDLQNIIEETCKSTISKTCNSYDLNKGNVTNYCAIVYRFYLAKLVDGYLLSFVLNYEPQYNDFDEARYKWYDVDRIECDLPFEIFYDGMEYVYMTRLELLTDCRTVFVSSVPYDELYTSTLLQKLHKIKLDHGYINAPYHAVMAKEMD